MTVMCISSQVIEEGLYAKYFGRFSTGYHDYFSWTDYKVARELKAQSQREFKKGSNFKKDKGKKLVKK